jgi:hypothetical protein
MFDYFQSLQADRNEEQPLMLQKRDAPLSEPVVAKKQRTDSRGSVPVTTRAAPSTSGPQKSVDWCCVVCSAAYSMHSKADKYVDQFYECRTIGLNIDAIFCLV